MEITKFTTLEDFDLYLINIYNETVDQVNNLPKENNSTPEIKRQQIIKITDEEWEEIQREEEEKFNLIWNSDLNKLAETRGRKKKPLIIDGTEYKDKEETAKALNVSVTTIKRMLKDGRAKFID